MTPPMQPPSFIILMHRPFPNLPPRFSPHPTRPLFPSLSPHPRLSSVSSLFPSHPCPPPPPPPPSTPHNHNHNHNNNTPPPSTPLTPLLSLLSHLLHLYNSRLSTHPLITKSITSALLVLLSDLLAQSLTSPPSAPLNHPRLLRYFLYGLFIAGPHGHFWFHLLHRLLPHPRPLSILYKILADQLVYSPLVTALFFALMQVAEGASVAQATAFVHTRLPRTMSYAWRVWPIVVALNFALVPTRYQLIFVSTASVFWVAFLSLVANDRTASHASV